VSEFRRADSVYLNARLGVFQGRGFYQSDYAVFRRDIGDLADDADQPQDRGDIHNRITTVCERVWDFVLHAQPHAAQIVDHEVPVLLRTISGQGQASGYARC